MPQMSRLRVAVRVVSQLPASLDQRTGSRDTTETELPAAVGSLWSLFTKPDGDHDILALRGGPAHPVSTRQRSVGIGASNEELTREFLDTSQLIVFLDRGPHTRVALRDQRGHHK